jgi:predicted nucleic acid-binding protein
MNFIDAGPMFAIIEPSDPNHLRCVEVLDDLPPAPMFTTWPCFTEAMYLLGRDGGYHDQDLLWRMYESGKIVIHETSPAEIDRMRALMRQYRDTPMDLADASLVAAVEATGIRLVFTVDKHFHAYRTNDGKTLDVPR